MFPAFSGAMESLRELIVRVFADEPKQPGMSLRAANALDDCLPPPPIDSNADRATAAYLEDNHWGIHQLDADSWRHYLPILMVHALDNLTNPGSMAIDTLLSSLRPPDSTPPRLGSLTAEQERAVTGFLEAVAIAEQSEWADRANIALEEYWAPGARYRLAKGP